MHPILSSAIVLADEMNPLIKPQVGLGVWFTVTFLLVAVLLKWKVWGPLGAAIDEREKSIKDALDKAKIEREQAEKLLADQMKVVAEARKEAADLVRKSQAEVEKAKEALFGEARKEAAAVLTQARQQIEEEKKKAISEIRDVAVTLAIDVASKLLAKQLDDSTQRALAEEFAKSVQQISARA